MTIDELTDLMDSNPERYSQLVDHVAQLVTNDTDLESLMNAYKKDLELVYESEPDILLRDACMWNVDLDLTNP